MQLAEVFAPSLDPLPKTVPLHDGQTYDSYCSSLAARNGFKSVDHLRQIFGLGPTRSVPTATDIAAFAGLGDLDRVALEHSIVRPNQGLFSFGGHTLRTTLWSGRIMRVCPQCVADDCDGLFSLERYAAPFVRGASEFAIMQTCPVHGLAYVDAAVDETHPRDPCYHLRKREKDDRPLPRKSANQGIAERYFVDRFGTAATADVPFLDAMSLTDAIDTCVLLGGLVACGPRGRFTHKGSYSDSQAHYCEAGFLVAQDGEAAINDLLRRVVETTPPSERVGSGLQRVFGTLARNLSMSKEQELRTLRSIVAKVALDNELPFWSAKAVFRIPIDSRERLSVAAAAKRFGIDERVLKQVLSDVGAIDASDDAGPSIFTLSDHHDLLQDLATSLNLTQAARALGVSSRLVIAFQDKGLISPLIVRSSQDGKPLRHFKPEEIDRFRREIVGKANRIGPIADTYRSLETAAMSVGRSSELLFAMAWEGCLSTLTLQSSNGNLADLAVDLDEVRSLVRTSDDELVDVYAASRSLGMSVMALRKLASISAINCARRPNPVNLRPQLAFHQGDIDLFRDEYIDLTALRRLTGRHGAALKRELAAHGVQPAFDPLAASATFFRRTDIPEGWNLKGSCN